MRPRIGIGVVGLGWMGQAHSRSYLRLATLFPDRRADPVLVACADTDPSRRELATEAFGFHRVAAGWDEVIADEDVDVVVVTAPNALHVEIVETACAAGKHVFCEKPVGGTPADTVRAADAARRAGVATAVGYNYRFAPLVLHARQLVADGRLGRLTSFRGRFLSMYGSDPLGLLSWRFQMERGGYGVSADLLSHAVDLAHVLVGRIARVAGERATVIVERPVPRAGSESHYGRGTPGDPTGAVTNEDQVWMLAEFENGTRGTFEASRVAAGPQSELAFELDGTSGSVRWSFERLNELEVAIDGDAVHAGFTTVRGGERFPFHGAFVPGSGNAIGFEDLVAIEDYCFLQAVAAGEPHEPGFEAALAVVAVQDALIRSWDSGRFEDVVPLEPSLGRARADTAD